MKKVGGAITVVIVILLLSGCRWWQNPDYGFCNILPNKAIMVELKNEMGKQTKDAIEEELKRSFVAARVVLYRSEKDIPDESLRVYWRVVRQRGFAKISIRVMLAECPVIVHQTVFLINAGHPEHEDAWLAIMIKNFYQDELRPDLALIRQAEEKSRKSYEGEKKAGEE